jgi:hypothetical protein
LYDPKKSTEGIARTKTRDLDGSDYETDYSIDSRTGDQKLDRKGQPIKKYVIDPKTG